LKNSKNQMCSGHGMCECGECVCDKAPSGRPYTGEICDCYPDDDACQRTPEEAPCSGHGTCTCGKCTHCAPGYSGLFCQHCTNISVSATVVLVYMHDYGDNIMHSCVLHIDLL
jgi:hypothetical protein